MTEKQEPQKQENMEQRKEQQQDKSEQMQGKRGYQPIDESKINWQELDICPKILKKLFFQKIKIIL